MAHGCSMQARAVAVWAGVNPIIIVVQSWAGEEKGNNSSNIIMHFASKQNHGVYSSSDVIDSDDEAITSLESECIL